MHTRNNKRPSTEPCGTPFNILHSLEKCLNILKFILDYISTISDQFLANFMTLPSQVQHLLLTTFRVVKSFGQIQ